jgi:molybdate transport system substrate-binding protein
VRPIFAVLLLLIPLAAGRAGEVTLFCSQALTGLLRQVTPAFERNSGDRLIVVTGLTRELAGKISDGQAFDLTILNAGAIDELARQDKLMPGSRADIGRSGMGVAIRQGAAKPDLGSTLAFKQALLAAHSIAYSAGTSGVYFASLLQRLGIADQVAAKSVILASGSTATLVASGDAELAVQQISELVGVAGSELAGPFPPELQNYTLFSAALGRRAANPIGATALIRFLVDPSLKATLRAAGLEPD